MKKLIIGHLIYIGAFFALGIYGDKIAPFAPTQQVKDISRYLSFVYFIYFTLFLLLSTVKNIAKNPRANGSKSYTFTTYAKIFIGFPILVGATAPLHYYAIAYGLTSIHAEVFSANRTVTVSITRKFETTGKGAAYWVKISGFDRGFKVSKDYYGVVNEGERYKIVLKNTQFGTKVLFLSPIKIYPPYFESNTPTQ